jgi:hypothetical protein
LPLDSVAVEPQVNEKGEREIWREPHVFNKLHRLLGPSESYSEVIQPLTAVGHD